MTPDNTASAAPEPRGRWNWALFTQRRSLVAYMLFVEVIAAGFVVFNFVGLRPGAANIGKTVLVIVLAIAFEELSRNASRMRTVLSDHLKPDMGSVWSVSAAIALPENYAVASVVVMLSYMWFRHQKPAGQPLYGKVITAATVVLACVAARAVLTFASDTIPGGISGATAVVIALIVFTAVNRGLVTGVFLLRNVPVRDLVGSFDDNMVEFATLCLGGLAALAVQHEPLLTALVLLPMALLQRGALTRQLEVAATTDSKTGLLNAITWEQLAKRDLLRAQRESKPLSVLIIDVDRFKWVNDVHGHLAGDVVLKAIGDALTQELRGYDTVGRFGGEEFVASLPNAGEDAALHAAERVRARINELRVSSLVTVTDPQNDRLLAVSIGVASAPTDGTELSELLLAADAALYVAKETGRNRVELAIRGAGGPTPSEITPA